MADTQAIVARFKGLSAEARRAAYHGILDQLRPHEWREVKQRCEPRTFQCDLISKLPIEIVAIIAEYLSLADLVFLQRVSRHWHRVLTSPSVCGAVLREVFGSDMVNSCEDLPKLLKRGLRIERGVPAVTVDFICPSQADHIADVIYGDGLFAWIDDKTHTSIIVVDLWTGRKDRFTTENRESLTQLRISKQIIAGLSTFGYCHVWDRHTYIHKSFRLPSVATGHFFIYDTKIMVGFDDCIVYFCFDSGLTRTIPLDYPKLVVLNPTKDEFSVAVLRKKDDAEISLDESFPAADAQLYIRTYALDSSTQDFHCVRAHQQVLPAECLNDMVCFALPAHEVSRGQSSIVLTFFVYGGEEYHPNHLAYLSLDPMTQKVVVHSLSTDVLQGTLAPIGKRWVYMGDDYSATNILHLCHTRSSPSSSCSSSCSSSKTSVYQYSVAKTLREQPNFFRIFADADFVVHTGRNDVLIWSWDEAWKLPDTLLELPDQ